VRVCPFCGADCAAAPVYDDELVEFETIVQGKPLTIPITELIETTAASGRKEYAALHEIKVKLVAQSRSQWGVKQLTDAKAYKLLEMYQEKVAEWCKAKGKKYNQWHKDTTTDWFFAELKRVFNWEPQKLEIVV
jgi:hypothetical protein